MAGVLAARLNSLYHDGGPEWLHRVADRVEHNSAAVLALASGRADAFLTEARLLTARNETQSCHWATGMARIQSRLARTQTGFARFETMSAHEEAQLARVEANRARWEARLATREARVREAEIGFDSDDFSPISAPFCPRIHVSVPEAPRVHIRVPKIRVPEVHIETADLSQYNE